MGIQSQAIAKGLKTCEARTCSTVVRVRRKSVVIGMAGGVFPSEIGEICGALLIIMFAIGTFPLTINDCAVKIPLARSFTEVHRS